MGVLWAHTGTIGCIELNTGINHPVQHTWSHVRINQLLGVCTM